VSRILLVQQKRGSTDITLRTKKLFRLISNKEEGC